MRQALLSCTLLLEAAKLTGPYVLVGPWLVAHISCLELRRPIGFAPDVLNESYSMLQPPSAVLSLTRIHPLR